ncbi:MAG: aminoacetone oxidase family FAD-binding enzyme [Lachnospiraceae bacterium]|nr:aminoacetone oxidase family FAD-binding enzyme [Lachnospiraceae bacterium]
MKKIVIAGGGASGLIAGIMAARRGAEVCILEHKDSVGKKILVTGNGKCNITNLSDMNGKYYSSNEKSLAKIISSISRFNAKDTLKLFEDMGLRCREKREGGVYPASEQSSAVLEVLRDECLKLGIKIATDCEVKSINVTEHKRYIEYIKYIRADKEVDDKNNKGKKGKQNNKIIGEERGQMEYDSLILATGGKALPSSGSDGSGYKLARSLGHDIILPLPALVQLKCVYDNANNIDVFKIVAGVRAQASIRLFVEDKQCACEEGELQLTDYGISGIPVFQFSRIAARALYEGKRCKVYIDFMTDMSQYDISKYLKKFEYKTLADALAGVVHRKVAEMICVANGISLREKIKNISEDILSGCTNMIKNWEVSVVNTNSFDNAQVCSGGVPLDEVSDDFESLKCKNVYIVGELLDCDGLCGGYNLQWAWTTGVIAGMAASRWR